MALERGGLRYPIEVVDRFSEPLLRFRDDLARARESWNAFRSDIAALKPDASGIRQMVREVRNTSAATREQAAASEESTKSFNVQKAALKALQAELQRNRVEAEKNRLAEQQGLQTKSLARQEAQRHAQFLKAEAAAQRQLTQQIKAAARAQQEAQKVKERDLVRGIRDGERADASARRSVAATQVRLERERQAAVNAEIARGRRDAIAILNKFDADQKAQKAAQVKADGESARRIQERARFIDDYQKRLRAAHVAEDAANAKIAQGHTRSFQAAQRAKGAVDAQNKSLERAEVFGNRLVFTFRRLIGAFAVFQAARAAAAGFSALLSTGIAFNQTLDQSRLGIAGILTSVGKLTDEQGRALSGAEKYTAAIAAARDQQDKLRQDALNTTATYRELLDTFQVAVGPGLSAGLNLDQVRQVAVLMSQAATAIGQSQTQLSEEIRAVLTGQIRQGQSRIATIIGLKPEDVRTAREFGNLGPLLIERLKGFSLAAQGAAQTVGGLFQRLRDTLELVTGRASRGLFEDLRNTLQSAFDSLTVREQTDIGAVLKPDPDVQKAFESLYVAVQKVLAAIRDTAASIGKQGFIDFAKALGAVIETVGVGLVNLIAGIIRGVGLLHAALDALLTPFVRVADELKAAFGPNIFNEVIKGLFTVLTFLSGIRIIATSLRGTFGLVGKAISGVLSFGGLLNLSLLRSKLISDEMAAGIKSFGASLLRSVGTTALLVVGLRELLSWVTGLDLSIRDLPEALGAAFESAFTKLFANIELIGVKLRVSMTKVLRGLLLDAKQFSQDIVAFFDFNFGGSDELARLKAKEREIQKRQEINQLAKDNAALELDVALATQVRDQASADADKNAGDRLNRLRAQIEERNALIASASAGISPQAAQSPNGPAPNVTGLGTAPTEEEQRELALMKAKNQTLRAEVGVRSQIAQLTLTGASQAEIELATGRAQLEVTRLQAAEKSLELQQQIELTQRQADAELNDERKALLKEKAVALIGEQALAEQQVTAELAIQQELLRRQELALNGTIGQGFQQGLVDFGQQFSSSFAAGIEIAKGLLNGFVQLVSSSIVDAFDPTQKFDLKERFARFLQDIAKLIIQQLTQIAIAKAILGLGLGVPGLADGGPVVGRAQGGSIPRRRARPSLAHFRRPRGLAAGGRPAGLDPTDTVPIWAAPGEWMMRVAAVRKYGIDVMARINSGLVDPIALKSLAVAGGRAPRLRSGHSIGFAEGGQISAPPSAPAASATVVPALIASEETMDTLIRGGERSLIDFMRRNADAISSGRRGRN